MNRLLLLALLLSLGACDSAGGDGSGSTAAIQATARDRAELSSSTASPFTLELDRRGVAQSTQGGLAQSNLNVLASSGLWVSGTQGGSLRTAQTLGRSTYASCGDGSGGVFHVFADTTYAVEGWPAAQGAPVNAAGAPRVYGDEMLWTATCQSPATAQGLALFDGLGTTVALFRYASTPNTVFARYEITNTSATPMTDVTVGLYSDTDLFTSGSDLDIYDNLIGLDGGRELGYVYLDQIKGRDGARRTDAERGRVAGVTLLQTPFGRGLTGHRITRKSGVYEEPRAFETLLFSRALQTLFNDGSAQIDWTTDRPDRLAFTGDPVATTGWLDGTGPVRQAGTPQDVQDGSEARMLLSSGAFSMAAGERVTLTVAWATASEPTLGSALGALRQRASSLRATPPLWTF